MSAAKKLKILNQIGQGSQGSVVSAIFQQNKIALKFASDDLDSKQALVNLRREASLLTRLAHPLIPKVYGVWEHDNQNCIAMEYMEGKTLHEVLQTKSCTEQQVKFYLEQLAGLLAHIHRKGIIHCDLKPQNIIITESDELKLVDFGLASSSNIKLLDTAKGTVHYASPEQLQIIDSHIDERSDLYSLGIIAFQCLSQQIPYFEEEVGPFLSAVANNKTPYLKDTCPNVSENINLLVHTLMQKYPENRIQSAKSLLWKLRNLDSEVKSTTSEKTKIRTSDVVGRSQQLEFMQSLFIENNHNSAPEKLLITAEPGMGKSRLTEEFIDNLPPDCKQHFTIQFSENSPEPLYALKNFVWSRLSKLNKLESPEREKAINLLVQAAGDNINYLCQFVPQLAELIKAKEIKVRRFDRDEYLNAISDFFKSYLHNSKSQLLVLEDIQWVDAASEAVLVNLFNNIKNNCFILMLSRPIEANNFRKLHISATKSIELNPLTDNDIDNLLNSFLVNHSVDSAICEYLKGKSDGTPLLIIEYLKAFIELGVIYPQNEIWVMDKEILSGTQLTGDITNILMSRLKDVSSDLQRLLACAGIIGLQFSTDILANYLNIDSDFLKLQIQEAEHREFIHHIDENNYQFTHDRLRVAFVGILTEKELEKHSYELAKLYARKYQNFEQAGHLLLKCTALAATPESLRILKAAAQKSLNNYDYVRAQETYQRLLQLQKELNQASDAEIHEGLADCHSELKDAKKSIEHYDLAIQLQEDHFKKSQLLLKKARTNFVGLKIENSIDDVKKALMHLNEPWPESGLKKLLLILHTIVVKLMFSPLHNRKFNKQKNFERAQLIAELYDFVGVQLFYSLKPIELVYSFIMSSWPGLVTRDPRLLIGAYCSAGTLFAIFSIGPLSRWLLRKSKQLAYNHGDPEGIGHHLVYEGISNIFLSQEVQAELKLTEAVERYGRWLGIYDYMLASGSIMTLYQARGHSEKGLKFVKGCRNQFSEANAELARFFLWCFHYGGTFYAQLGDKGSASRYREKLKSFKIVGPYDKALFCTNELNAILDLGEFDSEHFSSIVTKYESLNLNFLQEPAYYVSRFHILKAYIVAQKYLIANTKPDTKDLKLLEQALHKSIFHLPQAFIRYHRLTIKAYILYFKGQYQKSLKLISSNLSHFKKQDDRLGLYYAHLHLARCLNKLDDPTSAKTEVKYAKSLARGNNWTGKIQLIEQEFGTQTTKYFGAHSETSTNSNFQDILFNEKLQSLLKLNKISMNVHNPLELQKTILSYTVDLLRAERGFLFLTTEQDILPQFSIGWDAKENSNVDATVYSKSAIERCMELGKPLILSISKDNIIEQSESIIIHDLKSILVSPLMIDNQIIGVLYLDNRNTHGVFSENDKDIVQSLSSQIAIAIKRSQLVQLEIDNEIMKKDLELAGAIQKLILPKIKIHNENNIHMASFYKAAVHAGGDWWSWYRPNKDSIRIFIGDVTGHDVGSAMIMATLAGAFESLRQNHPHMPLDHFTAKLNEVIKSMCDDKYYVSFACLEYSSENKNLQWLTLGAPPIFMHMQDKINYLQNPNKLLGMSDNQIKIQSTHIDSDARILLFSDGINETRNAQNREFGYRRLSHTLQKNMHKSPQELVEHIYKTITDFNGSEDFEDDLSYIVLDIAS